MLVTDVYPASLPDICVARPVFVTGRYAGAAEFVSVTGRHPDATAELRVDVEAPADHSGLAKAWARPGIAELSDRHAIGGDPYGELVSEIRETALEHPRSAAVWVW